MDCGLLLKFHGAFLRLYKNVIALLQKLDQPFHKNIAGFISVTKKAAKVYPACITLIL